MKTMKIMNITKIFTNLLLAAIVAGAVSCNEQYVNYSDAEYVMFADTLSTHTVLADGSSFKVKVASTVARSYDRTFGVEVVDRGSNAIEGTHYTLPTNTFTIPAGKLTAEVEVYGNYENIMPEDSLGFSLQLVMPEKLKWPLGENSNRTKVVMYKSCPFDINNFTGYCVLSSMLLYNYPELSKQTYQKLVKTKLHPSEPNTIILEDCFYTGYDVTIKLHPEDPAKPMVTMDKDQVLSDEESVFGQILGDNHILGTHSPYYDNYFNSCQRFAVLWTHVYVENIGVSIGTVGHFYNILEWVTDEEAKRLQREEGW